MASLATVAARLAMGPAARRFLQYGHKVHQVDCQIISLTSGQTMT
jgi:hypothetical protein